MMLTDNAKHHAALEVVVSFTHSEPCSSCGQLHTGFPRIGNQEIAHILTDQAGWKHTCHLLKGTFKDNLG